MFKTTSWTNMNTVLRCSSLFHEQIWIYILKMFKAISWTTLNIYSFFFFKTIPWTTMNIQDYFMNKYIPIFIICSRLFHEQIPTSKIISFQNCFMNKYEHILKMFRTISLTNNLEMFKSFPWTHMNIQDYFMNKCIHIFIKGSRLFHEQ